MEQIFVQQDGAQVINSGMKNLTPKQLEDLKTFTAFANRTRSFGFLGYVMKFGIIPEAMVFDS